jgi:ferritin-like metal-binding protein YciE
MASTKSTATRKPANQSSAEPRSQGDSMLRAFFVEELKDIYWAEQHIAKALPKMAKAATSPELQQAFTTHLEQTEGQIERLESVFASLDEKAVAKKCDAMAGILAEGEEIISDTKEGTATRDVGLILAAQKVEHYEISTYGGLAQLARTLGEDEAAELLEETLEEEKETDELLSDIAENDVNYEASQEAAD